MASTIAVIPVNNLNHFVYQYDWLTINLCCLMINFYGTEFEAKNQEYTIMLENEGNSKLTITKGEKIAGSSLNSNIHIDLKGQFGLDPQHTGFFIFWEEIGHNRHHVSETLFLYRKDR